jgi:hypothetical protein
MTTQAIQAELKLELEPNFAHIDGWAIGHRYLSILSAVLDSN